RLALTTAASLSGRFACASISGWANSAAVFVPLAGLHGSPAGVRLLTRSERPCWMAWAERRLLTVDDKHPERFPFQEPPHATFSGVRVMVASLGSPQVLSWQPH